MPTSYSWTVGADATVPVPPNPGPYVPSTPTSTDPRKNQFERGVKFANVPGGKSEFVTQGASRVYHVSNVQNIVQEPIAIINASGLYSGAIKFRGRSYKRFGVPSSIKG